MNDSFPKRYKVEDIQQLQDQYLQNHPDTDPLFSLFYLPSIQPLHLGHFYGLCLKDFFLRMREVREKAIIQHWIVFQGKGLLSVSDAQQFFLKKKQTLSQVGASKLCNYLFSRQEKGIKGTKKYLSAYFGGFVSYERDEPAFSRFLQEIFREAWKADKILVRKNIAYRSIDLQTTVPAHQILFEQVKGENYTIKYFVETKNDFLPTCARIPDMIFGDVALLVHPQDKRYKKLIWKKAIIPVVNRAIPIIGDDTVNISQNNGIKRVCPCADFESIALAEKHHLPLDHFVFSSDGQYTQYAGKFAGKSRQEFYPNILQYLKDISNLWTIYEIETKIPYYIHTRELLVPFLVEEVVLDLTEEKEILQKTLQEESRTPVREQLLELLPQFSGVINRQLLRWMPIPLLKGEGSYQLEPLTLFRERKEVDLLQWCFDYVLFCLARDHHLNLSFAYGKLLAVFPQYKKEILSYFQLLPSQGKKVEKAAAEFLEILETFTEDDKIAVKFEKLVKNSEFLQLEGDFYSLVLPAWEKLEFFWGVFDSDFLSALYRIFLFQQGVPLDTTLFIEEGHAAFLLQELLLQQCLLKKCLYSAVVVHPSLLDKKGERFSYQSLQTTQLLSLLEEHGPSPVRLALLVQQTLDTEVFFLYDTFLRQLWNGVRYCALTRGYPITYAEAWKAFDTQADPFDTRIMEEFLAMWEECMHLWECRFTTAFPLIQQFVQRKFLWRYLEVKKTYEGGTLDATAHLICAGILTLIYPFVPRYVRALLQVLGLKFVEFTPVALPPKKGGVQVVWLYQLFDMIRLSRLKLGIKKHQKIALFVKSDPKSLSLFEQHQVLLKKLLNIQDLSFMRLHEAEPQGYEVEIYEATIIGIKLIRVDAFKKFSLAELESQYTQQLEYLEYLRTMVATLSSSVSVDGAQLEKKKSELEKVKAGIDKLSVEIQKLKMKKLR